MAMGKIMYVQIDRRQVLFVAILKQVMGVAQRKINVREPNQGFI